MLMTYALTLEKHQKLSIYKKRTDFLCLFFPKIESFYISLDSNGFLQTQSASLCDATLHVPKPHSSHDRHGQIGCQRGVTVTIVTTPASALRFGAAVDLARQSGLPIRLLELRFPSAEVGLPEGCESLDALPNPALFRNFVAAVDLLQSQLEQYFLELDCCPSCIISNKHVTWTAATARKFQIPRIIFDGMSCFTQLCTHNLYVSKVYESVAPSEPFVVPGLPDRIEMTRAQLPRMFNPGTLDTSAMHERIREAELGAYGVIINSFEELELEYVREYKKLKMDKVWCIGPLSLCNKDESQKAQRENKASIDEKECLKWLDSREPGSVVYACLGSLGRVAPAQLMELALGLESSNHPFIWVARTGDKQEELEKLIDEEGFEERTKDRGLVIRGWAPQVLILSHPAIGAFLTHCGWNSTLEGVCAGVPMVTWPQFAEQFFNEKLIVQVSGIGVRVGAEAVVLWGEVQKVEVKVKSKELKKAIEKVMGSENEAEERRQRVKDLREIANNALQEGGSSDLNLSMLIQDILEQANNKNSA